MLHVVLKGEHMLILRNISKQYERSGNFVLSNINLEFKDKGLVSVLGPSGCGKTTLLNLIGGLDTPSEGEIIVDDFTLNNLRKKDLNRYHNQYVGFVYQNYNLINYLNVSENIELIAKNQFTDKLLEYLHLYNKKFSKIKNLSGGEKQRVAIARSLINNPHILLCDEPTGALDIKTSHEIMELLKNISKNMLVIMVTHNKDLANKYSDRIITLEDGSVIKDTKKQRNTLPRKHNLKKIKISFSRIIKIILNNIKNKYKRNILTILAFSIGLIALSLVLAISNGFNKSLEKEEKESLSKYPIFISETSLNLDKSIKDIFSSTELHNEEYIYKEKTEHKNIITKEYIDDLNKINKFLNYQINTYILDGKILTISDKKLEEINIISGNDIKETNEVLLFVNNNTINAEVLESLGFTKEKYSYNEIINYEFKIKKENYKIVGIASIESDSYLSNINGLLSYQSLPNIIPLSISLYPKDYKSKSEILKHLENYKAVEFTDYSSTIKSLSKSLMNGITVILISFSAISLMVSTIMIGIISYISIYERIKEIGLFKSLGLSNFYIKVIFMGENVLLGIIASSFSFIVSKCISIPLNNILTSLTGLQNIILINSKLLITLFIISISLSLIGTYFPIRKTKKLKIIETLKYE